MNRKFLHIQPSELKFPFQLNKLCSCRLQVTNKTEHNVAFKVKTTHPKKYCVRPRVGVVLPGSTCFIEVAMQAQKEPPITMLPKDKFLIQSMILPVGADTLNVSSEMFRKEDGIVMEEYKLRVVLGTANPPSPIAEETEVECSSEASEEETAEHKSCKRDMFNAYVAAETAMDECSKDWMISNLREEKIIAATESQRLHHEVEMLKLQKRRNYSGDISMIVMLCISLLGFVVGYFIRALVSR